MRSIISFICLLLLKAFSLLFYRYKIGWPRGSKDNVHWKDVRLIVFMNHTSLMEWLYIGFLPVSFLRILSKRMVAPGADKTMNRPLVGFLFKLFSPGMVTISRKRDNTWQEFMSAIHSDSVIIIIPEGRMKRPNGLDLDGNKMNVRSGIADVLQQMNEGEMIIAYSGGLHHIHAPGEKGLRVFKDIKMNLETFQIADYKNSFDAEPGSDVWRKNLLEDLQHRLETKLPEMETL